jgi:polysaccharide biosynthesis/export protein
MVSALLVAELAGCSSRLDPSIKSGSFAARPEVTSAEKIPANSITPVEDVAPAAYRIGPLDELQITVFREPDLSAKDLPVDLNGSISLPLLGQVQASGKTSAELGDAIAQGLNTRYLRNAQVAVSVTKPVNFSVTVDGEVKKPGVYQIPGSLTLVQAIALGEGTTEYARQDEVIVFRTIAGQRYVARFDLREIRAARAPDPTILQSDVVVVGFSRGTRLMRDIISAMPGLAGVFIALRR